MAYKIDFDSEECVGCGACTCCDNWVIESDGKAKPIKTDIEEIGCNKEAEDICPRRIIKIREV